MPVARTSRRCSPIRRAIDRLSWTLDGWPDIVIAGRRIMAGPAGDAEDSLVLLRRLLPSMPERDEFFVPALAAPALTRLI